MKPEITLWQIPPQNLTLHEGELHLWRFNLDCSEDLFNQFKSFLDQEELFRADRLLNLQKRKQFIVARAYLKQILGAYQKVNPKQINLQYNAHGKPALAESHHSSLSFNLSHSENWAVLAAVDSFAVGIDLEKTDPDIDFISIVQQYFDDQEKLFLLQYSEQRQRRGFYRLWTRKEALLKADGLGFSYSARGSKVVDWYLKSFPLRSNYICSIATQKKIKAIKKFHSPKTLAF